MANYERILAIAVASGQLAIVFVVSGQLKDWQTWRKVTACPTRARSNLRVLIATYEPTLIVSEDPHRGCRKRGQSRRLLETLAQAMADEPVRHIPLQRSQQYQNRYEEAAALCLRFPEIDAWRPKKPQFYKGDSKKLPYFEALSYVASVLDSIPGPSE